MRHNQAFYGIGYILNQSYQVFVHQSRGEFLSKTFSLKGIISLFYSRGQIRDKESD